VVDGFTIRNPGSVGGIRCSGNNSTISSCVFRPSTPSLYGPTGSLVGILLEGSTSMIVDCTMSGCPRASPARHPVRSLPLQHHRCQRHEQRGVDL